MGKKTVKELNALRPAAKPYELAVDTGLYLRVATDGMRQWFVKYTVLGRRRVARLSCPYGDGPGKMSLADATAENARIRALARNGIDFQVQREEERQTKAEEKRAQEAAAKVAQLAAKTVRDLYGAWIVDGVARKDGNKDLRRQFEKDVLPAIGSIELRKLSGGDILSLLRAQTERGIIRQAIITYGNVSHMLKWGRERKPWNRLLEDGNPAKLVDMDLLIPTDYEDERTRILTSAEIGELADIFRNMDASYADAPDRRAAVHPVDTKTRIALWLCLSTVCRIGELLRSRWEHVDLDAGTWFIPLENVKGHRGKKNPQTVYLSDFALRQFKALHEITGDSAWCFPARNQRAGDAHVCLRSVSKQVGDRQIRFKDRSKPLRGRAFDDSLVLAGGERGDWTPHDLRRTGATMMQALGVSLDTIDRCQNHLLAGRVRRVYLRHDYEAEKTAAWQVLGDRLDAILAGAADIVQPRA
ncbi:tyrosine-type recombinase/integrase [Castellaniella sp. MT123]|uniref:tyrosine-type recombinase/integrase n=1 Tax=Castellaniella sp. MT123 TaxID=3140381 RepID=UPI0031F3EED3